MIAMKLLPSLPRSHAPLARSLALSFALSLAVCADAARAVGVALLPSDVLTQTERDVVRSAVRDAGHTVLDDAEVLAAIGARPACAHDDVPCLARIALLADAGAVVSFARRPSSPNEEIDVVVVDADPRVGRATTTMAGVGTAVVDAIASLSTPPSVTEVEPPKVLEPPREEPLPREEPPKEEPPKVDDAPANDEPAKEESAPPANAPAMNPWALAGAGLAGAGLVALAAGSYAAVLAGGSMQEAEAAPFQDDSARFGNTANEQLWLSGGAFALGVGAMAGGAALIFLDGGEP